MKSQLDRILKSDLSQYKIALSDHTTSLDHFQECLTERQNFMQNFNDLLKRQLQRMNQAPPSKFNQKQIQSSECLNTYREQFSYTNNANLAKQYQTKTSIQISQNTNSQKQSIKIKDYYKKLHIVKHKYIKNLHQQIQIIKLSLKDEMQRMKRKVISFINQQVVKISQKINIGNQIKIKELLETIQKLKSENYDLKKNQLKQECNLSIQKQFMKIKLSNDNHQLNKSHSIASNHSVNKILYNNSPIEIIGSARNTSQKSRYLQNQRNESMPLIKQITIKSSEPTWKHYVYGLQSSMAKQGKFKDRIKQGKQNFFTFESKEMFVSKQFQKAQVNVQKQPNVPAPLRKNTSTKTFQIPLVKSLTVNCPPIQQGFSALKIGNETVYKGMWKYKKFHGKGKLILPQYMYEGDFQHGFFHGRGNLKIGSLQYIGQFFQNKAQGQGTLKIKGIQQAVGRWKSNILIQKY